MLYHYMFRIAKDHLGLEVKLQGHTVRLEPHALYPNLIKTAQTIASSEELLASNFLCQYPTAEQLPLLKEYFQQRGWQVKP